MHYYLKGDERRAHSTTYLRIGRVMDWWRTKARTSDDCRARTCRQFNGVNRVPANCQLDDARSRSSHNPNPTRPGILCTIYTPTCRVHPCIRGRLLGSLASRIPHISGGASGRALFSGCSVSVSPGMLHACKFGGILLVEWGLGSHASPPKATKHRVRPAHRRCSRAGGSSGVSGFPPIQPC
jgi:hypothetical protein